MIRRVVVAVAVAAMVFSMDAVFAGGGHGPAAAVRIKNIGAAPVLVNAANSGAIGTTGGRLLSHNAVAQFNLKKGAGTALAATPTGDAQSTLPYNFPNSKFVYLQATGDGGKPSIKFAPPGTRF